MCPHMLSVHQLAGELLNYLHVTAFCFCISEMTNDKAVVKYLSKHKYVDLV